MDAYVAHLHAKSSSNRLKNNEVMANNVKGVRVLGLGVMNTAPIIAPFKHVFLVYINY